MDMKKSKRLLMWLAAIYWLAVIGIYAVAQEQFHYTWVENDAPSALAAVGELVDGMTLEQRVSVPADSVQCIEARVGTYGRENAGEMHFALCAENGEVLAQAAADVSQFADNAYARIPLDQPLENRRGQALTLRVTTQGCAPGRAATLYFGHSTLAGRVDVARPIAQEDLYVLDGHAGVGMLCVRLGGVNALSFYWIYWVIVTAVFAGAAVFVVRGFARARDGEINLVTMICTVYSRYSYLIYQLVVRDFKAKYKRSTLGMCWSFLNPLLTMAVQYVVFSMVFKSDTPNYPVYLLCGIVFFNFFSEAVSQGLMSIAGNAALINKVYVPKFVYPDSRVIFSLINFVLAFLPIFLVMLFTGTAIRPAMLLILFDVACLVVFTLGMVLLLSTAMVFFRDTQFLWGVLSMIWMYMTPIFYPETIIPQAFLPVYRLNPLYQFITFARTTMIQGISPAPQMYLGCIAWALVMFLIGMRVFRKHQNEFVLYI